MGGLAFPFEKGRRNDWRDARLDGAVQARGRDKRVAGGGDRLFDGTGRGAGGRGGVARDAGQDRERDFGFGRRGDDEV